MKLSSLQALLASATIALSGTGVEASSAHQRLHQLDRKVSHLGGHGHAHAHFQSENESVKKRAGTCSFFQHESVLAVTPSGMNAGWGIPSDRECTCGSYCPYVCKSPLLLAQWKPGTTYKPAESMLGGLFCDKSGELSKPFPDRPYCVRGVESVKVINKCKSQLSWCQTMLPGDESMIIPTLIKTESLIAVPDEKYWASTAAHYYINPPGTGEEDCKWGDDKEPIGNWAPFVAGANAAGGKTYVKLGWNPKWEEQPKFKASGPGFGLRVECPDGGCNGLPCEIDPSSGSGKVGSKLAATGAGGSDFCVVTVEEGKMAHIVMFDGSGGPKPSSPKQETSTSAPPPPPPPKETSTTVQPTTSTSSPPPMTPSSSVAATTNSTSSEVYTTPESTATSTKKELPTLVPGIFHENTTTSTGSNLNITSTVSGPSTTSSDEPPKTHHTVNEAGRQQGSAAVAGLVVAFIAAAVLF
ncbi:hypothetical protein JDV02_007656 [Purpureocillium takamizusanense]|uniref:Uncharacterized protein n=1 Tax=Purpureocillium takamizusanense TaxID=2060973 RepID=A0A9Q8QM13_9HYPO|nr:uncharacterized protein JDV02_007656 [Purpureocillium takamizusanense]UNI21687.1 hypothetical protein JDV02_007656 [Purpureocillium takamizusanense]